MSQTIILFSVLLRQLYKSNGQPDSTDNLFTNKAVGHGRDKERDLWF